MNRDDVGDDNDDNKDDGDDDKQYLVPACIEKDSSMCEPWRIFDLRPLHQVLKRF